VQRNSGAVVPIRCTMGLNIPRLCNRSRCKKGERETWPVVYALRLRASAEEDPPEHRLLCYSSIWLNDLGVDVSAKNQKVGCWAMETPRLDLEDHLQFDRLVDLGPNCCRALPFISHVGRQQAKSGGQGCITGARRDAWVDECGGVVCLDDH